MYLRIFSRVGRLRIG